MEVYKNEQSSRLLTTMIQSITRSKLIAISTGLALAAIGAMAPNAQAEDFVLDFENVQTNADGTLVTTQWSDWGLTNISGVNNRTGNAAKLNAYDTSKSGRDNDLRTGSTWGTGNQGNVLIIQEEDGRSFRNGVYKADDEARGGNINFDFASEVMFNSFTLLDIDDNGEGIDINGFDGNGNQVIDFDIDALMAEMISTYGSNASDAYNQSVTLGGVTMTQKSTNRGDNSMFDFSFSDTYVSNIDFFYPGSGAISDLKWSTVEVAQEIPEPTGLAGLLVVGGLAARSLRKRKQSA